MQFKLLAQLTYTILEMKTLQLFTEIRFQTNMTNKNQSLNSGVVLTKEIQI